MLPLDLISQQISCMLSGKESVIEHNATQQMYLQEVHKLTIDLVAYNFSKSLAHNQFEVNKHAVSRHHRYISCCPSHNPQTCIQSVQHTVGLCSGRLCC